MPIFIEEGSTSKYGSWNVRRVSKNSGGRFYYLTWRIYRELYNEQFLHMLAIARELAVKYAIDHETGNILQYTVSPTTCDDSSINFITIDIAVS